MPHGKNTQQYRIVKKNYPNVSDAIAGVIDWVCQRLLAEGLITEGQRAEACNGMISASKRASVVTGMLLKKVEQDAENFQTLVGVLQQDMDTFGTVLKRMGVTEGGASGQATTGSNSPGTETVHIQQPGPLKREENICKLAEVPHKQSSLQIPNPVVQYSKLSTDEQEDLQAQIEQLKFEIHRKFLKFEADLVNSLRERITAANVVRTLLAHCTVYPTESMYNVSLLQEHRQALLDAKDIEKVFVIIHPFYTYYNYELLQTIVDVHGSEKDGERMQQYILDFSSYCRRVPCMEYYDDHCQTSLKRVKLKFKLDYDKKLLTLADIKNIQRHISKILNIKSSVLFLHSVTEGCTAITFLVPDPCICVVLKVLKEKSTTLQREVKMMTIECDGKPIDEVPVVPEIEKAVGVQTTESECHAVFEAKKLDGMSTESRAPRCTMFQATKAYVCSECYRVFEAKTLDGVSTEGRALKCPRCTKVQATIKCDTCKQLFTRDVMGADKHYGNVNCPKCGEALKEGLKSETYKLLSIEHECVDSKGERKAKVTTTLPYHKDDQQAVDRLVSAIASIASRTIEGSK